MLTPKRNHPLKRKAMLLCSLSLMVAVLHVCFMVWMSQAWSERQINALMPPRIQVAYVSEIHAVPPVPAKVSPAPPPAHPPSPPAPPPARAHPAKPQAWVASATSAPDVLKPFPEVDDLQVEFRYHPDTAALAASSSRSPEINPPLSTVGESAVNQASAEPIKLPEKLISPPLKSDLFHGPKAIRISYTLRGQYRGELNGSAQVEWLRQGDTYQVLMDIQTGPVFQRQMRSEGVMSNEGLWPRKYSEKSKLLFKTPRLASMLIDSAGVLLPSGQRLVAPRQVQDPASQFIQLTYLFQTQSDLLLPGKEIPLAVATPRNVTEWVYDVLEPETLNTPIGRLWAFQLRPRRIGSPRPHDLKTDVWFSPALYDLPIRIRIEQDNQHHLDLHIAKNPEIAH